VKSDSGTKTVLTVIAACLIILTAEGCTPDL
jgi:hypothetical protein